MFWDKIKASYTKKDFDYSTGYIDPKKYHHFFFALLRSYQVTDEPFPRWTYVTKSLTALCGIGFMIVNLLSLYYAIDTLNVGLITEAGTYILMLTYKIVTLIISKVNLPRYLHLTQAMKEDFKYIETKKEKYREQFFAAQLETWKVSFITVAVMFGMNVVMLINASALLVVYVLTHAPGDRSHRPLAVTYWAPGIDFTTTPFFEIAFMFTNIVSMACYYNFTFALLTNVMWIREMTSKAEMIKMCIKDLLEDIHPPNDEEQKRYFASLIKFRMKEIISQHTAMYNLLNSYAAVYRKCLMIEQLIASPIVCMLAYCSAEKLEKGEVPVVLMVLCAAIMTTLFVPSYLCTYLRTKLSGIGDACWDIRFWDAGPTIRPYLVLIMQRCSRPLPLHLPGFQEVSIKTFSSKMVSAYSLFNMLRQANFSYEV